MIKKVKTFFSGKNSLMSAATILVFTTLLSNILGLVRDRFFAQKVPIDLLDTYFAAFRIPDFIFNILILGTISAAFIPVFLEYKQKSEGEAWAVADLTLNLALLLMAGLSVILFLVMPILIPWLVPDFSAEKQELTTALARILLLQLIFLGASYIFSGILNAMKRFLVYSLAPLVYTTSIIVFTILFADQYHVFALVWGVVAGAFFHMLIQAVVARSIGWRWQPIFDWRHLAVIKIVRLLVPRSIGLGSFQVALLAVTAIASGLGAGSVAIYNFADNIQTMPTAVFGLAFITALYPTLAEMFAQKDMKRFAALVWRGIRYLLFILAPAGIGLILLRAEIVRLILGTGHFGWGATVATADTLGFFAFSLFAQAGAVLLARSFYALQDTKTPTIINIISYLIAIALAIYLAPLMGVPGLALAISIAAFGNMVLLYLRLRTRISLMQHESTLVLALLQLIVGLILLTVAVQFTKVWIGGLVDMQTGIGVAMKTLAAITVGAFVYWITMKVLKVPEIAMAEQIILAKVWPSRFRRQKLDLGFEDLIN